MSNDDRSDSDAGESNANEASESSDIGATIAGDLESHISLLGHFYRGQLDRETTWRTRLDRTTNWAVLVIATLLTWTFSGADNPHYILLVGVLLVVLFLGVEAHRYRAYDVPRSRVRMLEEDLFSQMFDPEHDIEHDDWRRLISQDLRQPAATVSVRVAAARRLRRIYLALVSILLGAWIVKLTVFQPGSDWVGAAELPPVPGYVVLVAVGVFYAAAIVLAVWSPSGGRREVEADRPRAWHRDSE